MQASGFILFFCFLSLLFCSLFSFIISSSWFSLFNYCINWNTHDSCPWSLFLQYENLGTIPMELCFKARLTVYSSMFFIILIYKSQLVLSWKIKTKNSATTWSYNHHMAESKMVCCRVCHINYFLFSIDLHNDNCAHLTCRLLMMITLIGGRWLSKFISEKWCSNYNSDELTTTDKKKKKKRLIDSVHRWSKRLVDDTYKWLGDNLKFEKQSGEEWI